MVTKREWNLLKLKSDQISKIDDDLLEKIRLLEIKLREHVNVRLSVPMSDGRKLVFGKTSRDWKFMIVDDRGSGWLESASREERVLAVPFLETLIRTASNQLDQMAHDREQAIHNAEKMLEALSG